VGATKSCHTIQTCVHHLSFVTGVTIRFDSYKDAEEQMLHVLEVETNSPAELAGLVPFKDYLLGTAEKAFTDADVLQQELVAHIDRPVEFYVYNTDTDEVRVVVIMPTEVTFCAVPASENADECYLHCARTMVLIPLFMRLRLHHAQDWGDKGNQGLLGANVAFGYLHVLPTHCCETIGK
jgi:hypothetical protein